jgi:hypothetical protein
VLTKILRIVAFLAWVCVGYVVYLVLTPLITWFRCVMEGIMQGIICV